MLPDFQPPIAADEHDQKLLSDVERVGWHVPQITGDDRGPGYSFSVGLYYTFGHPEILVMGLRGAVAHAVINSAGEQIAKGRVFQPEIRYDEFLQGYSTFFVPISITHYEYYLGYGIWFYRKLKQPFPALQLVWPDKQGHFPWEDSYDKQFNKLQKLLNA
jgi:Domain of unknown function (DUF4262)